MEKVRATGPRERPVTVSQLYYETVPVTDALCETLTVVYQTWLPGKVFTFLKTRKQTDSAALRTCVAPPRLGGDPAQQGGRLAGHFRRAAQRPRPAAPALQVGQKRLDSLRQIDFFVGSRHGCRVKTT